jgi:hypothetical protein
MFIIDEEKMFLGAAINFNDICWIYPKRLKEIISMGQDKYHKYLSLLVTDIREVQKELRKNPNIKEEDLNFTAFEYLFMQYETAEFLSLQKNDRTFLVELKEAFSTFIREEVHFSKDTREIFIGNSLSPKKKLTAENFEDFQNILRAQHCLPTPEPIPENESPMARKFRLRREQVAEAKRKQNAKNGETVSLAQSMSTLVCLNVGVTPKTVGDLTMYQFRELLSRAQAKYKYDLDIRMIAAGADPKKIKPKHWFGKLD